MKQNIIVLSVNPYQMVDKTGKQSEGTSIRYLLGENLDPVQDGQNKGNRPAKDNLPYDWRHQFPKAPALYEVDLGMRVGSDGKPAMFISSVNKYISDLAVTLKAPAK